MLKYFFQFICCILLSCVVIACHLDGKKPPAKPPTTPTTPTTPTQSLIWSGSIEITNAKKYQDLLGSHRKCIHNSFCTFYEGPGKCSNFSKGDISVQFEKSELPAKVTVKIQAIYSGSQALPFQFWFGVCSFNITHQVPIVLNGTAQYFNDYQGFHVRLTGLSGISGGLIIRSSDGLPEAHSVLSVDMYYGGSASESAKFGTSELENPNAEGLYPNETGGR